MDQQIARLLRRYWAMSYSVAEITAALGSKHRFNFSYRHIQRLLNKLGLKRRSNESPLAEIVSAIGQELGSGSGHCIGIRPMQYRLQRKYRLNVSRQTVNDLLNILTPVAVAARRTGLLTRRVYEVRGPNHIWHCDGYDKLKPFGICIHGAIDGWSRKLVWLQVDRTNNDPNVICKYYTQAVREAGHIPRILRVDAGTENVAMADVHTLLRQEHNGEIARKPVIVGTSVHNQRIERWWHYLKMSYVTSCLSLFKDLRDSGILNVSNGLHIECLRFCFIPVIAEDLRQLMDTWNNHRIRKQAIYCPAGRPSFLYSNPQLFGCLDMKAQADLETLDICEEIYSADVPEYGSTDEFSEIALEMMLLHDLHLPTTLNGALDLFGALVTFLDEN